MKQPHNIRLEFDGKPEELQKQLQYLVNELKPIGIEALVDAYQNSEMIRKEVNKRVKKYEKKQKTQSKKSVFDKLLI